jgi:predicted RNA binding protein YcfA (HicA-like mRNA interferase family)/predicted RNase H-like HicB family nuclease
MVDRIMAGTPPSLSRYRIVVGLDDNGTSVAYVPAISGCHAMGSTRDDAVRELANVFAMIADEFAARGKDLPPESTRPITARDIDRVAARLGFQRSSEKGSHMRRRHPDGRATTIPLDPHVEIGGRLFDEILRALGITQERFEELR